HCIQHFPVHRLFQLLEVDHESRYRIHLALHRDFQCVIVPVAIGISALPEEPLVLFLRQLRIVVIVRGGKFGFACEINHSVQFKGSRESLGKSLVLSGPSFLTSRVAEYVLPSQLTPPCLCSIFERISRYEKTGSPAKENSVAS